MNNELTVVFTKNNFSIISWLVRYALPRSRFALALSSHCYIAIDDLHYYQASPTNGVCITTRIDVESNDTIIGIKRYAIEDIGLAKKALDSQLGKKYDFMGALGLLFDPNRKWHDDSNWYCFELAAYAIRSSNGVQFNHLNHITETALLACSLD